MRSARPSRPTRALSVLAVGCVLLLPACRGGEESAPTAAGKDPIAVQPNGKPADPDTWPLTGLDVAEGQSAEQRYPVLVLKMDNSPSSAPQVGLGSADLVVEELVEGGITRLAAFFYSAIPADVGPVRSMRASDIGIVSPVGADVVTSGAAAVTIERIAAAGIDFFAEGDAGFYRSSSRGAPYNLFTDLRDVATSAMEQRRSKAARPADYLPWGAAEDLAPGQKARGLAATFSGGHTTRWTFRGGRYVNENSYAARGDEFDADSVLVLRVPVGDAGYRDPAGNFVPETRLVGRGEAMLFHDGRLLNATWRKKELGSPLDLTAKGEDLGVPPGRVWIELVPADGGSVTVQK